MGKLSKTGLTDKQERFCQEYCIHYEATFAAQRAGYSSKNCGEQGYQLIQNPSIQKRISEIQEKQKRRIQISQDRIVGEFANIGFFDVRRLYHEDGTMKHPSEFDDVTAKVVSSVKETTDKEGNKTVEVKFWDKTKALVKLGEQLGLWKDNQNTYNQININANRDEITEIFQKMTEQVLPKLMENRTPESEILEMKKKFGVETYEKD